MTTQKRRQLTQSEIQARRQLGQRGEVAAARWYEERGWEILARNWRCGKGELDIVTRKGEILVFCEVKTRSRVIHTAPGDAVNWQKQQQIRKLAYQWLAELEEFIPKVRFDVAEVVVQQGSLEVRILENAF